MNIKTKQDRSSRIFGLRLSLDDAERVRKMAEKAGLTMSSYIRRQIGLDPLRRKNAASKPNPVPLTAGNWPPPMTAEEIAALGGRPKPPQKPEAAPAKTEPEEVW
jgi:hypothetical protein